MKRFITMMVCAVIALFYTDVVTAQTSSSANVTVNVQSTLQVSNLTGDLAFGNRMPGGTYVIPAAEGVNFRISGASDVPVFVTYTPPGPLAGPFSDTVTFIPQVIGGQNSDGTGAVGTGSESPVTTDASGNYYLWLGGSIIVGNIRNGNYSGMFTVTVDYNL